MPKFGFTSIQSRSFCISTAYSLQLVQNCISSTKKGYSSMPLPFLLGADGKTCLIFLKKRRAIAADQRDAVRASASRGSDGSPRIAAQVFTTACADMASPLALGKGLYILGSVLRTERCPCHNRKVSRCLELRQILRAIGI